MILSSIGGEDINEENERDKAIRGESIGDRR